MLKITLFLFVASFLLMNAETMIAQSVSSPKTGIEIGRMAPNITMQDVNGNDLNLYSLRGNVVYISFWAAWCRPCRYENKALVETFMAFKGKKFTNAEEFRIFSVSLDRTRENWIAAIEKDGLVWSEHVSSLQGWESPVAKTFEITTIPANILLNADGVIIAKNIQIDQLNELLNSMVR
jgi:peroxiredoxin